MKKVSIVMPVYNGKEFLRESIDSVINQTYKNWELIVVNEFGSNDGSAEIIQEYMSKDDRIKLIQNTKREGISESLNIGFRSASGDYFARMDSDDLSCPDRFQVQVDYLDEHKDIGLCGIQPEFFGTEKIEWDLEKDPSMIKHGIFFYTPCVHPTIMFRREIMDDYKIFYNKDFRATEDYEFFSRVCGVTNITNIIRKDLFRYRTHTTNATYTNNDIGIKLYDQVMKNCFNNYLNLSFTDEEIQLLDCHISTKGKTGKELYDAVVEMDLLLKKVLVEANNSKNFDVNIMFKVLKKRWQEVRWNIPEKNLTPAISFILDKSIFNRNTFDFNNNYDTSKADITVLMPVYNSEKYILDSVSSLLDQSYKNFILYVMVEKDNKDDTEKYLSLFSDNRIKIVKNKKKLGLANTLNEGIKSAKTKYIARMDSDDLSAIDRLEKERKVLEQNDNITLVSTWQRHFGDFGTYVHQSESSCEDLAASLLFKCDICHSTVMFRTKNMIDNDYFYNSNMAMEDFDLWNRMLLNGEKLYCIPEVLGDYRIHGDNITQAKHQQVIDSEINIISRSLEKLHIDSSTYDSRLLIGWDYIYNDHPELKKKAKKLFDQIIDANDKYGVYSQSSIKKALTKRNNWVNGIDDYVVQEEYTSPNKQSKLKGIVKKVIRPFIKPFYSRLMYRIENKIDEKNVSIENKLNNLSSEKKNLEDRIELLTKSIKNQEKNLATLCSSFDKMKAELGTEANYIPYEGGKIRICFIFQVPSFWPSFEGVYNILVKDKRFDFKFYLLDESDREPSQMKGAKDFLEINKIRYELLTIDKLMNFNPHIAIIQTPYDKWHRSEEFSSSNLRRMGIRLVHIPYGMEFSATEESIKAQFNSEFANNMWRIYTSSESTQRYYCLYSKQSIYNIKALGHPKFDGLYKKKCTTKYDFKKLSKNKKIFLVKIHFPKIFNNKIVTPDLNIYINLIKNIKKYNDAYFIFMLHPLMFDKNKSSVSQELVKYLNASKDIFVYKDEDYREPLYAADAFICDRSSISVEIAQFNKPTMYMENKEYKERYVEEFDTLFNCYEKGYSYNDLDNFILSVLDNKAIVSPLLKESLNKCINNIDGKTSDRIVEDIYNSITNNDQVFK